MQHSFKRLIPVSLVPAVAISVWLLWSGSHVKAQSAVALTAPQLTEVVRESNMKISASGITVVGSGPAVTVLAEEDAKSTDQDLKIDAVFISKALIDTVPNQIRTVKVLFTQAGHPGRFINVNKSEVLEYGSGKLSAPQLLSSLFITDVEPERAPTVQQGPQYERRLILWRRIDKLRQAGTGVKPFEDLFQGVESVAKSGDADKLEQRLEYLESKLSDQEEQLEEIRKAARGHGVPAAAAANSVSSGSGSKSGANGSSLSDLNELPPHADEMKRLYTEQGDALIRQADMRSHESALALRTLKGQVDRSFASNHQVRAIFFETVPGAGPKGDWAGSVCANRVWVRGKRGAKRSHAAAVESTAQH